METVRAILSRRSVRHGFSATPVPRATLELILQCGLSAPSSKFAQPWRFHVVTDAATRSRLAALMEGSEDKAAYVPHDPATGAPWPIWPSTVDESAQALRSAPAAIFIENLGRFSRSRRAMIEATPEALANAMLGRDLEFMGLGTAIQSMWIAAVDQGLCGVFMGDVLIAETAIRQSLGVEGDLAGVLVLGYGETTPEPRPAAEFPNDAVRWL